MENGTSSLLHVLESVGVPRTGVWSLAVNDAPAVGAHRPVDGDEVKVRGVERPRADAEGRVLLTKDRSLLRRAALRAGAYVRGDDANEQLADVLDCFDPGQRP